jgi:transcription-repair coupling factor (superfamily II helicase)
MMTKTGSPELVASLVEQIAESVPLEALLGELREGGDRISVSGLAGSARAIVLARMHRALNRPLLAVVPGQEGGEALRDDLEAMLGAGRVLYLPEFETSPYDIRSPHLSILDARLNALAQLVHGHRGVTVTTARSLATQVVAPEVIRGGVLELRVGDPMDADDLAHWLADLGYRRVSLVEEPGDMARRGGIVDVFSFGNPNPVRIEFNGDEIASMRGFEPMSQRSVDRLERALLLPRREVVIDESIAEAGAAAIRAAAGEAHDAELHAAQLLNDRYYIGMRRISGFIDQGWGSLLRYFPADLLTVRDRPDRLAARAAEQAEEVAAVCEERRSHHELVSPPSAFLLEWDEVESMLTRHGGFDLDPLRRAAPIVDLMQGLDLPEGAELPPEITAQLSGEAKDEDAGTDAEIPDAPAATGRKIRFEVRAQESFGRAVEILHTFMRAQMAAQNRTIIFCDNPGQRDHLRELLGELYDVEIEVGHLSSGFLWREVRLCVLTDHEIFARFRRRRSRRRFKAGISIPDLMALKQGDHVVHIDHGIGVYQGTRRLTFGGHETDCLEIHYQRGDKLFIPADQFDLVQKYALEEGQRAPSLSRLGGTAWARAKAKAKKAILDMAEELLAVSAIRNSRAGFAFSAESVWQRDLESSFAYDDTPDQARASIEVKRDMEAPKPMDRLVCGDVGYGMARPKWQCGRPSRRCRTRNRWRSSCQPPSSPSSISPLFASGSMILR